MRRIKFQKAVLRGPEFTCSSCHRMLYRKSVTSVTDKLREKIKAASEDKIKKANEQKTKVKLLPSKSTINPPSPTVHPEVNNSNPHSPTLHPEFNNTNPPSPTLHPEINNTNPTSLTIHPEVKPSKIHPEARKSKLKKKFSFEVNAHKAWNYHLIKSVDNLVYLCSTCRGSLLRGNMPSMAVANGLQLRHPDRPRLTPLEQSLIALNINFQKIVLLPRSGMAAGKGRLISVPVNPSDVMNTASQLPRLPSEAGLIPIKLKRKKEYKTHVKHEKVRPEQLFLALRYLRGANHPFYQFYDDYSTYKARLKIKEERSLTLLEGDEIEENVGTMSASDMQEVEDMAMGESDDDDEDAMDIAVEQEEEDIQNDPVRRQHFNYNEYSTLVNGHPDIFLNDEGNQVANLDFAPGEGKKPSNFLDQKHWDIKSWPTLLPDGKFGLHHERKVKLTAQKYFHQRILNVDNRFAENRDFIFSAMSFVEAGRLRASANLTGMKGTKSVGPGGHLTFQLGDPCSVFERIPGTPKYWQRVKYEMIAKLENIGPFQVKKWSHSHDFDIS